MAFGKKKDEAGAPAAADADDDAPLFPDTGEADDETPGPEAQAAQPPVEAAVVETPPPPAEAAAPSTDSLLSAFQTNEGAADDRSVLIEMAGDVDLADLLEELNTLAAAMNVVRR